MNIPFVDLVSQYQTLQDEIVPAMENIMSKAQYILGNDVSLFEREFADYCEASYAIGVDSGTSALELALRAYGIGAGDEVITVANTFIATALAISKIGAKPVFVDITPDTYLMDVTKIEKNITPKTKAILPVHLYGHPVDMDAIMEIARENKLIVIEDACQAHGAKYKGRRTGSLGHAAAFSFYPGKNLGAYGDGGIVVSNDKRVEEFVKMYRDYGQKIKYHHCMQGYNHRLDTLQAAVLRIKLRRLDTWNQNRRRSAEIYKKFLSDSPVTLPEEESYAESVYHLFVIRTENREELKVYLQSQGISAGIHYPVPIHLQEAYRDLNYERGDFPITEEYADQILSLPMYPELTPGSAGYVAETVNTFNVHDKVEMPELAGL